MRVSVPLPALISGLAIAVPPFEMMPLMVVLPAPPMVRVRLLELSESPIGPEITKAAPPERLLVRLKLPESVPPVPLRVILVAPPTAELAVIFQLLAVAFPALKSAEA